MVNPQPLTTQELAQLTELARRYPEQYAMDRAVRAFRDTPTAENREALMTAQRRSHAAFIAEQTGDYQGRTHGLAGADPEDGMAASSERRLLAGLQDRHEASGGGELEALRASVATRTATADTLFEL